jgi:hypothetical protein
MRPLYLLLLLAGLSFSLAAQTRFGANTGEYATFLSSLEDQLVNSKYRKRIRLGGEERNQFVQWIRDNVHVMKAMKFLDEDISSFWEFFMKNQTAEGLYFDYYYTIANPLNHRMNLFDQRYWHIFSHDSLQMHRLPVEADLEYLMVEGAYYIWQATGDEDYLKKWLPGLEKGLQYSMTDPLRWSEKYQLIKRGYTLDTWDFMQLPMSREAYVRSGKDVQDGIFNIGPETPMGIMHGDNSGLYAACNQLAQMFAQTGEKERSDYWQKTATGLRERANKWCWNGRFYAHFVEDDPQPDYLQMDQQQTLSLSNPYDINRGLPDEDMAASIIQAYQALKGNNNLNAFAEWFGVYPPIEPDFAGYKPGSYMNGGVNTIVAGELAKAAFQHGYEAYGVDIINRLIALNAKHGELPVSYQPDGTIDEGIPDNWGQAAVYSSLIEGLAGVVDLGRQFDSVEISPRWPAAEQPEASVSVTYPGTGKTIAYDFLHHAGKKTMQLQLHGDAGTVLVRLLLPDNARVKRVSVDGERVSFDTEKVGNSGYAVFRVAGRSNPQIELRY